ncbi:hypothetical protein ABPG75_006693 [Micractinium tetrahymenae]
MAGASRAGSPVVHAAPKQKLAQTTHELVRSPSARVSCTMCFFNKLLGRKQGRAGVPENPAGAVLGGNYKVLNVLGTGTFSSVYLVQSLGCGRQYAVKQTSISELSRAEQ